MKVDVEGILASGQRENTDEGVARKLAALSHPARLALLRCLGAKDACCVKDLVGRVGLAQSTVSQHIKILLAAGLVDYQAERQSSRYSLNREGLGSVLGSLDDIVRQVCGDGCCMNSANGKNNSEMMAQSDAAVKTDRIS